MKRHSRKVLSRAARPATFALEGLEVRRCLSVTVTPESFISVTPDAAASVPYRSVNPSGTDAGDEQLISTCVIPGSGVRAVLAYVQRFTSGYGDTTLRLYLTGDNGTTWHEQDINTAFDGFDDDGSQGRKGRKDDTMAADPSGNLYIESSSDQSGLAVDRLTPATIQEILNGQAPTSFHPSDDVAAFHTYAYRPQVAAGLDPTTGKSVVYVYNGEDVGGPLASTEIAAWEGTSNDSFSLSAPQVWGFAPDNPEDLGGDFCKLTVDGHGTLYGTAPNGQVYSLTYGAAKAGAHPQSLFNAPGNVVAYTDPSGSTTLYMASSDIYGDVVVASRAASGTGGWVKSLPIPGATDISVPRVDPTNGQISVVCNAYGGAVAAYDGSRWFVSPVAIGGDPNLRANANGGNDATSNIDYSVYGGVTSLAFTQVDTVGNPDDVGDVGVSINNAVGERLTVGSSGATAGEQVGIVWHDTPHPTVTINGVSQSYPSDPVVDVVVEQASGRSLSVDWSSGTAAPIGSITFDGDGAASTLTVSPGNGHGSAAAAMDVQYAYDGVTINGLPVAFSDVGAVTLNGGVKDLYVAADRGALASLPPITLGNADASTTVHVDVTGASGDDNYAFTATALTLDGHELVAYPSGTVRALDLTSAGHGHDALTASAAVAGYAILTGGDDAALDSWTVTLNAPGGDIPDVDSPVVQVNINAPGDYNLFGMRAGTTSYAVKVDDGAHVTVPLKADVDGANVSLNIPNGSITFDTTRSQFPDRFILTGLTVPIGGHATVDEVGLSGRFDKIEAEAAEISGTLTADVPDLTFDSFTGAASGQLTFGTGAATDTLTVGTSNATSTFAGHVSSAGTFAKQGTGTLALGAVDVGDLTVNSGTLDVGGAGTGAGAPLDVTGTLDVADGAAVFLLQNAGIGVTDAVGLLDLHDTGRLDLGNSSLQTGTDPATLRAYLIAGRNGGAWDGGSGITSTYVATRSGYAVGYASASDALPNGPAASLSAGQTLVRPTLAGDANLDGSVGLADYNIVSGHYNQAADWAGGDFDYDGTYGLSDYNLMMANYNHIVIPVFADPGAGKVVLEADPTTGRLYLVGDGANINSYEVDSAGSHLTFIDSRHPGGWDTLAAQTAVDYLPASSNPDEQSWSVFSFVAHTSVIETYPGGGATPYDTFGPGVQAVDLNATGATAWTAGTPVSDLTFLYGDGTGATFTPAVVDLSTVGTP